MREYDFARGLRAYAATFQRATPVREAVAVLTDQVTHLAEACERYAPGYYRRSEAQLARLMRAFPAFAVEVMAACAAIVAPPPPGARLEVHERWALNAVAALSDAVSAYVAAIGGARTALTVQHGHFWAALDAAGALLPVRLAIELDVHYPGELQLLTPERFDDWRAHVARALSAEHGVPAARTEVVLVAGRPRAVLDGEHVHLSRATIDRMWADFSTGLRGL